MKKLLFLFSLSLCAIPLMASNHASINKEDCTITIDDKTYPLYGDVKLVESGEDIRVEIVEYNADLEVKPVEYSSSADDCGEIHFVEYSPDVKVKVVEYNADIKVKVVKYSPGLK